LVHRSTPLRPFLRGFLWAAHRCPAAPRILLCQEGQHRKQQQEGLSATPSRSLRPRRAGT
jgi:hypothetical protein